MTDRESFLKKIIDFPDDDTPRLVFADWLDEHGESERAEFIRVQIKLAVMQPTMADVRKSENLLKRYRKGAPVPLKAKTPAVLILKSKILLESRQPGTCAGDCSDNTFAAARYVWAGPVAKLNDPDQNGWEFSRGFVDSVICTWSDWLAHHAAILAATPLREVRLTTPRPQIRVDESGIHLIGSNKRFTVEQVVPDPGTLSIDARMADKLLSLEWPRIKFSLPPEGNRYWTGDGGDNDLNNSANWRQSHRGGGASASMGLPFSRD